MNSFKLHKYAAKLHNRLEAKNVRKYDCSVEFHLKRNALYTD